jgi:hypothetical protein
MTEYFSEKTFLDFFKAMVRYIASGFISIFIFQYLRNDQMNWWFAGNDINWPIVVFAAITGITIYSIHTALLDDIFYRLSLWYLVRKKKNRATYLPTDFKDTIISDKKTEPKKISFIMFSLTTSRFTKSGEDDPYSKAVNSRLEHLFALLVFLYTSSYPLIVLPIAFVLKKAAQNKVNEIVFSFNFVLIFVMGLLLITSGFFLDLKITQRELFNLKAKD